MNHSTARISSINALLIIIFVLQTALFCQDDFSKLHADITTIIGRYPGVRIGIQVYSVTKQKTIIAKNETQGFTPASTTKIVTAVAALDLLGNDYQFTTALLSNAPAENGTLKGDLYLKGSGDPSLTSADLQALFKQLRLSGITCIEDNFFLDISDFDEVCFAPGTTIDDIGESYCAPVLALCINKKAAVHSVPLISFFNKAKLDSIFFSSVPFIKKQLAKLSIMFNGSIEFQNAPSNCISLALHNSKPLAQLITHMLKNSDNLYADCLFKRIGSLSFGSNEVVPLGTWRNGEQSINKFLKKTLGISPAPVKITDGSGKSRYNLLSPHSSVMLLRWAYATFSEPFLSMLPIGGVDGTLKNRFNNLPASIFAKTGTMSDASALSGFIKVKDDLLIFSILSNEFQNTPVKSCIEEEICKLIATECEK